MQRLEIMSLINAVEEKFPVNQWKIDGVYIWPLIRIGLYFNNADEFQMESTNIRKRPMIIRSMIQSVNLLKGLAKFFYAYFADYNKNNRMDVFSDTVFYSNGISFSWIRNAWYEKHCDPIMTIFKKNGIYSLLMTPAPLSEYYIPRHSPSVFIQPLLDFIKIKSRLLSAKSKASCEQLIDFSNFIKYLKSQSASVLLPDLEKIRSDVKLINAYKRFFKKVLKRNNPSLVFLVCYYNLQRMALNLACFELDIKSIDIQHGLQGDYHVPYGRWHKIPKDGYSLLPSIFWCWSYQDAEAINKWSRYVTTGRHKAIVGGNPFIALWEDNKNGLVEYYDKKIIKIKEQRKSTIHILYTLQGIEGYDRIKIIIEVMKNSSLKYHWWIRLHPCYLFERKKNRSLLRQNKILNFEIDAATDLPLFAILRHMDVHLTQFSSTVIEAKYFGVPSVITHEMGEAYFPDLISSGWVLPAYTTDQIATAIKQQSDRRKSLITRKDEMDTSQDSGIEYFVNLIKKSNGK